GDRAVPRAGAHDPERAAEEGDRGDRGDGGGHRRADPGPGARRDRAVAGRRGSGRAGAARGVLLDDEPAERGAVARADEGGGGGVAFDVRGAAGGCRGAARGGGVPEVVPDVAAGGLDGGVRRSAGEG